MIKSCSEIGDIERIDKAVAIHILVRRVRVKGRSEKWNIEWIDEAATVEITIADVTDPVPVGITLAESAGIGNEWTIGYGDTVIQVVIDAVPVRIDSKGTGAGQSKQYSGSNL